MNKELTELENKIKGMSIGQLIEYSNTIKTVSRFFTIVGVTSILTALMYTTALVIVGVGTILYIIGNMAVELDRVDAFAKACLEKKST